MRVAVVGAGGFIGRSLVKRLNSDGYDVLPVVRTPMGLASEKVIPDINSADWGPVFEGMDAVVHLAARVHMMSDQAADPLAEFRRVNTAGTLLVANAAARVGVRRFVFLSTIKVHGEATDSGQPFRRDDPLQPSDPYGISKAEAERAIFTLARATGIEVTVVRPPLVYGPGVKGNLGSLIKLVRRSVPLPLGSITDNRRSLVGVDNLTSLISSTISHPAAANATFLVSDDQDVSTTKLLRLLAQAMGKRVWLLPIPSRILHATAGLVGKKEAVARLIGSLQVDISHTREKLGWTPPLSLEAGIKSAVFEAPPV